MRQCKEIMYKFEAVSVVNKMSSGVTGRVCGTHLLENVSLTKDRTPDRTVL